MCVLQLRATVPRSSPVGGGGGGGGMGNVSICWLPKEDVLPCSETTNQMKAVNDELLGKSSRSFRRPPSNSKRTPSVPGRGKVQTEVFCME